MYSIFIVFFLFMITSTFSNSQTLFGDDITSLRIIGGEQAMSGQFPYVVSITISELISYPFKCTGSLIAESWVITAAHCYRGIDTEQDGGSRILAGSVLSDRHQGNTQVRYSLRYIVHDKVRDRGTYNMDVALVQVSEPYNINDYVRPIALVKSPFPLGLRMKCTSIGYGLTDEDKTNMNARLHFIHVIVGGSDFCNQKKPSLNAKKELLCQIPYTVNTSTCDGDSGGPVACNNLLAGVLSGTAGVRVVNGTARCTDPHGIMVSMFAGYFQYWIKKYIPNLAKTKELDIDEVVVRSVPLEPTSKGGRSDSSCHRISPYNYIFIVTMWINTFLFLQLC